MKQAAEITNLGLDLCTPVEPEAIKLVLKGFVRLGFELMWWYLKHLSSFMFIKFVLFTGSVRFADVLVKDKWFAIKGQDGERTRL